MSRRKQQKPQHIESESEIVPALQNNQAAVSPSSDDAHVCGRCRAEFFTLPDFLLHKKTCSHKRIVLMVDEDVNNNSDCEESYPSQKPGEEITNNTTDTENSDHEDIDQNGKVEASDTQQSVDVTTGLPQFSSALYMDSNVMLEPLQASKAAVAQFAENNLPSSDIAMLHTALFSLQQQQLIQLQLIRQLQTQIANGSSTEPLSVPSIMMPSSLPSIPPPSAITPPSDASPTGMMQTSFDVLVQEAAKLTAGDVQEDESEQGNFENENVTEEEPKSDLEHTSSMKHTCRYCSKTLASDGSLQIHLRIHTGERPFKCNVCNHRFTTRGNLKVHYLRHRHKYPHIKKETNEYSSKQSGFNMSASTLVTSSEKSEKTDLASAPASISPRISNNFGRNSASDASDRITQSFTASSMVSSVARNPLIESSFPSSVAVSASVPLLSTVTSCGPLMNGMIPIPPPIPSFPAMFHSSILPDKDPVDSMEEFMEVTKSETDKLQKLVESLNTKASDPNQCVICHRILSCKSALQMHYRIHTGERPYKCKLCSRAFTTKGNLKTHMGVHRSKPPLRMMHQCPVCHKQFTNALVLQQHIRLHTESTGTKLGLVLPPFPVPTYLSDNGELDLRINRPSSTGSNLLSPSGSVSSHEDSEQSQEQNGLKKEETEIFNKPCISESQKQKLVTLPDEATSSIFPNYSSTSLAALEERVRAMDSELQNSAIGCPWEQEPRYTLLPPSLERSTDTTKPLEIVTNGLDKTLIADHKVELLQSNEKAPSSSSQSSVSPVSSEDGCSSPESKMDSICNSALSPYADSNASVETNPASEQLVPKPENPSSTTCTICNKSFACKSALEIHYRAHTRERPFCCEVCGRGFTTRGNMRQHMLTHKIRDLPSEVFEPVTSPTSSETSSVKIDLAVEPQQQSDSLKRSRPIENGQDAEQTPKRHLAKHQCSVCYKPFSSSSALQIHFRTHTGDKPYKCNFCGKAFTTKGNLKVHMGTHMWNNGATRRGRRVSVENVSILPSNIFPNKDMNKPPLNPFPAPTPEMYLPYPPFMNGFSPNKMAEFPMMPGINGLPTASAAEALIQMQASTAQAMMKAGYMPMFPGFSPMGSPTEFAAKMNESLRKSSETQELDESNTKRTSTSNSSTPEKESPKSAWSWKTTCYVCNKVCSSVSSLDQHMKSAHDRPNESSQPLAATS